MSLMHRFVYLSFNQRQKRGMDRQLREERERESKLSGTMTIAAKMGMQIGQVLGNNSKPDSLNSETQHNKAVALASKDHSDVRIKSQTLLRVLITHTCIRSQYHSISVCRMDISTI